MIEISISKGWPGNRLSNLAPNHFNFDGVKCASMESLLQAFKFRAPEKQVQVCAMSGTEARFAGKQSDCWKHTQVLYWQCHEYARSGVDYQALLDRAFSCLSRNLEFESALLATGSENLTFKTGCIDPLETVLTKDEFIDRLLGFRMVTMSKMLGQVS